MEITVLGFKVSVKVIAPDTNLIDKLLHLESLSSIKDVERFAGLVNILGRFIPHLSEKMKHINNLRKNNVKFNWDEKCQRLFDLIKMELSSKVQ